MSKYQASIVAIGNELTRGSIIDTNSGYISRLLQQQGLALRHIVIVEDEINDIKSELRREVDRSDLVLTTGGLGPTSDDLTRQAIAEVAAVPLEVNASAKIKLEELFAQRKRPLNPNNLRQIEFPEGAEVVLNRIGTADAFVTRIKNSRGGITPVVSLPGVPKETEIIFTEQLIPWLEKNFPAAESKPVLCYLRAFGCSESYLGMQIESANLPSHIEVAYRPMFPEILLTFTNIAETSRESREAELKKISKELLKVIGEQYIYSNDPAETLAAATGKLLVKHKLTLAAAESCSGGLIAHSFVSNPGASEFFVSSVVTYSNDSKAVFAGARPALIEHYGAVSKEVALEMARSVKYRSGADIGVSVTGIAGPGGGTAEKPAGTFHIGLATADFEDAFQFFFPHERNMFRTYCAALAIELVRRKVLGFPLTWERK